MNNTTTTVAGQTNEYWTAQCAADEAQHALNSARRAWDRAMEHGTDDECERAQATMDRCQWQYDRLQAKAAALRVTPEPTPQPPTTPQPPKRQSTAEARQMERERAVWHSLNYEGPARYSELVEVFTVASTSTPGARYTITHDLVTGAIECNCPAGTHRRNCLHAQAVTRYLANRAACINKAADEAVQAAQAESDKRRDTSILRRPAFSFMR